MSYVKLRQIINDMNLEIVHESTDLDDINIYSSEISRPGLQIVGYFEKFVPERIQIIGSAEWHYYNDIPNSLRYDSIDKLFSYPIPAFIISRDLPVFKEIITLAKKHNITILRTKENTSKIINKVLNYIDLQLAPETRVHGVFVEVYGVGVLITGKSGVGKSETALDLVIRGHRLVSDDVVVIKKNGRYAYGEIPP